MKSVQRITLQMPESTPLEKAEYQISMLHQRQEYFPICVLGGPLSAEQLAENKRRRDECARREIEIIIRHGVADAYIEKYERHARPLREQLCVIERQIDQLKIARDLKRASGR
jgi:hypothetical protein